MGGEGAGLHLTLDLGERHGCIIRGDGQVYCWGANEAGQTDPSVGAAGGAPVTTLSSAAPVALPGGAKAVEVAAGGKFSCARLQSGQVACWGSNNDLVNPNAPAGFMAPTLVPVALTSDTEPRIAIALAAGSRHFCILRDDGTVLCHGSNASSKLGHLGGASDLVRRNVGPWGAWLPIGTLPTATTAPLTGAIKIVAGGSHACALDALGNVYCWGSWGQLDGQSLAFPVQSGSAALANVIDVTAGGELANAPGGADVPNRDHSCAILVDHSVRCWGDNFEGQLGAPGLNHSASALPVSFFEGGAFGAAVAISAGAAHTCATTLHDRTFCWGTNNFGETGRTDTGTALLQPRLASPVSNSPSFPMTAVHSLDAGNGFSCALALTNTANNDFGLRCWGRNDLGQLGTPWVGPSSVNAVTAYTPDLPCGSFVTFTTPHGGPLLDSGHEHTCAVVVKSTCTVPGFGTNFERGILCWGRNDLAQAGDNFTSVDTLPTFNPMQANVLSLSVGGHHACVVDTLGRVWCWGANSVGQCGLPASTSVSTPTIVPWPVGLPAAVQVSAGADYTCAVLTDGTAACWGSNEFGTLGRIRYETWTTPGLPPPPLVGADGVTPVAMGAGAFHSTPSRVLCACPNGAPLTNVKQVSAGAASVCALTGDGTVRCSGRNPRAGQGNRTTAILGCTSTDLRFCDTTAATPYPGISAVLPYAGPPNANFGSVFASTAVSMHEDGGCLVRPDHIAQCWGDWGNGRASNTASSGMSQFVSNALRVPASGGPNVLMREVVGINGGWRTKCATRASGETWCWGLNTSGQAGQSPMSMNVVVAQRVSDAIGPLSGAIGVSVGQSHACAMRADQSIMCWGSNANTHLGSSGGDTPAARAISVPL